MNARDKQLAVLLRKAQWMLDDAAFNVMHRPLSSTEREAMAEALTELSQALTDELDHVETSS